MYFETLVKVIFKEPVEENFKNLFLGYPTSKDEVIIVDDKTYVFSWRFFHGFMSMIIMGDMWDRIYEVWQDGSGKYSELYFSRNEEIRMVSAAFKFYIDMSPSRAIVICPQGGDLEFREIFLDGFATKRLIPGKEDYKIFIRRYITWVYIKSIDVLESLCKNAGFSKDTFLDAFREVTKMEYKEFCNVVELPNYDSLL